MKRNFILSIIFASLSIGSYAQGEIDAFNLSYNDLGGTARSVSMGGAFGALGGDISGIAINPAGIGVYKSSELVTTLNFTNTNAETNLNGFKSDDSKFKFIFDNLAFVGVIPLNSDVAPLLNVGFSYNRLKSFDRKIAMRGDNLENSLTDHIAGRANESGYDKITLNSDYNNGADRLGTLGHQAGVIKADNQHIFHSANPTSTTYNDLTMRERGDISSYDFNIGTTFSDILSVGVTVAVTDIYYRLDSDYYEEFINDGRNYYLTNWLETEGSGWQVKAGLILKPIEELRIGVSYHSPTWYQMTDYYWAEMDAFGNKIVKADDGYNYHDYEFRTPDKWTFSLAGVIAKRAIISADYELTNYANMHLADYNGVASYDNQYIKQDFRNSSTLRLGAEVRFTPQFSGRVGYMWQQSPVKESFKNSNEDGTIMVATAGTVPQYSLVGDANNFTWGLGYRFTPHFYTDVAFVIKNRTDDLYNYAGADKAELKTNQFTGLLTLGYKF